MTRKTFIEKHPLLFIGIIKEGIELALHGYTEINNVLDVEECNKKIEERTRLWESLETQEFLHLI